MLVLYEHREDTFSIFRAIQINQEMNGGEMGENVQIVGPVICT